MITVYTNKDGIPDIVTSNDSFFGAHTCKDINKMDAQIIQSIDSAILLNLQQIQSFYGLGDISNLSTGCKTVLNVKKNPDRIFCLDECGENARSYILNNFDNIAVCITFPLNYLVPFGKLCMNGKDYIESPGDYYNWWSKYYSEVIK